MTALEEAVLSKITLELQNHLLTPHHQKSMEIYERQSKII